MELTTTTTVATSTTLAALALPAPWQQGATQEQVVRPTFEELFETYHARIYSYVHRLVDDTEEAYELTQDTFLKAYLGLPRLDPHHTQAWLFRIASHVCLDALRHRKLVRRAALDDAARLTGAQASHAWAVRRGTTRGDTSGATGVADGADPQAHLLAAELHDQVQTVLDRLNPRHRMALVLREYHGLAYEEIATALRVSRASVKSLIYRAREEFRQAWLAQWGAAPFAPVAGTSGSGDQTRAV